MTGPADVAQPGDLDRLEALAPDLIAACRRRKLSEWLVERAFDPDVLQASHDRPVVAELVARVHAQARTAGDCLRLVELRRHRHGAAAAHDAVTVGHAAMRQKNYAFAADSFAVAAASKVESGFDTLTRARALRLDGRVDAAREVLLAAWSTDDATSDVLVELAVCLLLSRDLRGALDLTTRVARGLEDDPPEDVPEFRWLHTYLQSVTNASDPSYQRLAAAGAPRLSAPEQVATADTVVAVLDYKGPELLAASMNIGDVMQSVAVLRLLARYWREDWALSDPRLAEAMRRLQPTWGDDVRTSSDSVGVQVLDRDMAWPVLDGWDEERPLWVLYYGWFLNKPFGTQSVLPVPPAVRPLFVSFYLQRADDLTPEVVESLRRVQPIGCRDWPTTYLLLNQGIDAFFSGCVTTTLAAPGEPHPTGERIAVDHPDGSDSSVVRIEHNTPAYRALGFSEAVDAALDLLERYRDAEEVTTSRLHCYLPGRAAGAPVSFFPGSETDRRFDGLAGLDDAAFASMGGDLQGLLTGVLDLILAGAEEADVYRAWRTATEPLVASARRRFEAAPGAFFEVGASAHGDAATHGRPAEVELLDEVTIAVAFDANLVARVPGLVRSIRANTSAELSFVLLVRGVADEQLRAVQAVAEDASFRVLHMDDYLRGSEIHLAGATTISTMDRLFMPDLLEDLDRVVYLDIDTIVLGDVAELAGFTPSPRSGISARPTPNHNWRQQFTPVERRSHSYPAAKAHDYRRRAALTTDLTAAYFNAGVLVLSLETLRSRDFTRQAVALVEEYGVEDQETMNLYSGGDYCRLPARWNVNPRIELIETPSLIHWAGAPKPWARDRDVLMSEHWRRYQD